MIGEHTVLNDGRLVLHKITGVISHQELVDEARRIFEDPSIRSGAVEIVDVRQASFPETPIEMFTEIADLYASLAKIGLFSKAAVVAPLAEEEFSKFVKFERVMARYGVNFISFANLDVACTWIGYDSKWIEEQFNSMLPS